MSRGFGPVRGSRSTATINTLVAGSRRVVEGEKDFALLRRALSWDDAAGVLLVNQSLTCGTVHLTGPSAQPAYKSCHQFGTHTRGDARPRPPEVAPDGQAFGGYRAGGRPPRRWRRNEGISGLAFVSSVGTRPCGESVTPAAHPSAFARA